MELPDFTVEHLKQLPLRDDGREHDVRVTLSNGKR